MSYINSKSFYILDLIDGESYGRDKLIDNLLQREIGINFINHWQEIEDKDNSLCLILGKTEDHLIQNLFEKNNLKINNNPEGIYYQWCSTGKNQVLVIAGTDERGLMYALLEIHMRIENKGLKAVFNLESKTEFPEHRIRGIDKFIMGPIDGDWFYDESFWNYYLARLAKYRYNRFVLITGFDTGYMSPPYPFFVEVPGYEQVEVKSQKTDKKKNLKQLRNIGKLCNYYNLEFFFGSWQQTPWTEDQEIMIKGLTYKEDSLSGYCNKGLKTLLKSCPEIEGIQLRVNLESGVGDRNTAENFWKDIISSVAEVEEEEERQIKLALRAKGLTDNMIKFAQNKGLELEIPTKYWCEHSGLPYHLTRMRSGELNNLNDLNRSRRYSYSDLLEEPFSYDINYRLWNFGSTNILLWGDPDYARRFVKSISPGKGKGFEIAAPLSLKGGRASIQEENWSLIENDNYIYYEWEDERYWFWYLVFGRLGYSTKVNREVWEREFEKHFPIPGIAKALEQAYRAASKVLPLITAFHMPVHPALIYWTELSTGGALFAENNYNDRFGDTTYINTEPSDPGLFYGIDEYVEDYLEEKIKAKYTPIQVKEWLQKIAEEINDCLIKTLNKQNFDEENPVYNNKEFYSTKVDFKILKNFALYHSHKIKAAVNFCLFQKTKNKFNLKEAQSAMQTARKHWYVLSRFGQDIYNNNLIFGTGVGTGRCGHWQDRLEEIDKDLEQIKELLTTTPESNSDQNEKYDISNLKGTNKDLTSFQINIPKKHSENSDLEIILKTGEINSFEFDNICVHYRNMNQLEGEFQKEVLVRKGSKYKGEISANYLDSAWDLMIYFSGKSKNNTILYPGIYHAESDLPYFIVQVVSSASG